MYFLLTRDLGFIKATAQGVRLAKSKLKGHLQVFSLTKVSVVKGKDLWRITNAEAIVQNGVIKNKGKLAVLFNSSALLLRLIHGEEKDEKLFECVESAYILCRDADLSPDELKNTEILTVLRIMHFLGYIKKAEGLTDFAEGTNLTPELLADFSSKRKLAISEINTALKETHL